MQCGLLATYPAQISTIFKITNVNRCADGDRHEKFPNFCAGSFSVPKRNFGVFGWGACTQRAAHTPQFRVTGDISGDCQNHKDVPFVREF